MFTRAVDRLRGLFSLLWREIMKFGTVGGVAYLIDSGIYLYLLHGPLADKTLTAKIIAGVTATVFSWIANRYWTFRHRRRAAVLRELFLFGVMNAIGLGIATFCVFVSHYVLGYQTATADFIAGNVVGLVLGTIFRFLAYRYWVFTEELAEDPKFAAAPGPALDEDPMRRHGPAPGEDPVRRHGPAAGSGSASERGPDRTGA